MAYLSLTGGTELRDCVKLIMKKIFSKDVARLFSYCGRLKKKAFNEKLFNKTIIGMGSLKIYL